MAMRYMIEVIDKFGDTILPDKHKLLISLSKSVFLLITNDYTDRQKPKWTGLN